MDGGLHAFVGRAAELDTLDGALSGLLSGRGRLYLVGGEPGIGKTSLADELATRAAARGVRALWGRCWEGGAAPAYWPWTQIFRELSATGTETTAAELAPILPELVRELPSGEAHTAPSTAERFRLFDAAAAALRLASDRNPLLLVFDDMHAADESSLLLLRFCARELPLAPVLMLCTYREAEVRLQPAIAGHFADLSREGSHLRLGGWDIAEVGECLRRHADPRLPRELGAAIQRLTEGNPFFVKEVAREVAAGLLEPSALLDEARPLPVPDGVRETIGRRLALLPADVVMLLRLAAMIGREFDAALVHRLARDRTRVAPPELVGTLDPAAAAGLIIERRERIGSYTFSHALVRETLRHDITPVERMSLHRAIGEALEEAGTEPSDEVVGRLAYHFFQANAAGGAEKAVRYSRLAGAVAMRTAAYEGAAAYYQQGLDALRFLPADDRRRAELLLELGDAQRRARRLPEARAAFRRGAKLGREISDADLAARAALGFGRVGETGVVDTDLVGLLQDTLDLLPDADGAHRSRVLARLAMALYFSTDAADRRRRDDLSLQALEMARRLGDPSTLGAALIARHFVLWGPGTTTPRLLLSAELIRLAVSTRDEELELEARLWHALDMLESGDGAGFEAGFDAFRLRAEAARLPLYRWHVHVLHGLWALACGRVDEAFQVAEAASELGGKYHVERAQQFYAAQVFFARREKRDLADLEPALRAFAEQFAALPVWRCGLALLYAEVGRQAEARHALAAALTVDPADWAADGNWLPCLVMLAEVCAAVDDRGCAARLRQLLEPHAGTQVVLFDGIALLGPFDHFLGLLTSTLSDRDAAVRHFTAALRRCERLGAAALAERSRRALTAIGGEKERPAVGADQGAGAELGGRMVFRREGAYWTVAFGGLDARLKHSRGLAYLAHLLRHPGEEFHALELAATAPGGPEPATTGAAYASPELSRRRGIAPVGEEVLDAQAKAEYRQRLRDLQEELAEAEELNDLGRVGRLQEEMHALTSALSSALGLGGRSRLAVTDAERARIAVTKAITMALKVIGEHNTPLRRYLARTIKTGTFSGYRADRAEAKAWELGP